MKLLHMKFILQPFLFSLLQTLFLLQLHGAADERFLLIAQLRQRFLLFAGHSIIGFQRLILLLDLLLQLLHRIFQLQNLPLSCQKTAPLFLVIPAG